VFINGISHIRDAKSMVLRHTRKWCRGKICKIIIVTLYYNWKGNCRSHKE